MAALRSPHDAPAPRSPFALADQLREVLRTRSPNRFARLNVRVANGAVALTGQVPNWQSKALALRTARSMFHDTLVIDALEVPNRRTFARSGPTATA